MSVSDTGFVVGLAAEARLLRSLKCPVEIGGGGFDGAYAAAERLIAAGVRRIVSFGLAGGLDTGLPPGSLLVPARVLVDRLDCACDPTLMAWLGAGEAGALLGGRSILASRADKAAAFAATRATAVDLESGAVALAAQQAGASFAVLRAVCDPADRDLPPAALLALDQAGRIGLWRVVRSLIGAPRQIVTLMALGRDAGAARTALRRRVDRIRHADDGR